MITYEDVQYIEKHAKYKGTSYGVYTKSGKLLLCPIGALAQKRGVKFFNKDGDAEFEPKQLDTIVMPTQREFLRAAGFPFTALYGEYDATVAYGKFLSKNGIKAVIDRLKQKLVIPDQP